METVFEWMGNLGKSLAYSKHGIWPIFVYAICPICPSLPSNWRISLKIRLSLWTKKCLWVGDVCLDCMRIINVHNGDTVPPHQVARPILPEEIWVLVLDDFMLYVNPVSTVKMLRNTTAMESQPTGLCTSTCLPPSGMLGLFVGMRKFWQFLWLRQCRAHCNSAFNSAHC